MAMQTSEYTFETEFINLFKKHEYRFYTLAACFTKSDQFAKDIVQATFLKLWDKRESLKYVDNVERWLYRQTEEKIIHFLQKAALFCPVRDALWVNMQKPGSTDDDGQVGHLNFLIENAVQHLPPQRQNVYAYCQDNSITYHYIKKNIYQRNGKLDNTSGWAGMVNKIKSLVSFLK